MTWYTFSHCRGIRYWRDSIDSGKGDQAATCASSELLFKGFAKISTGPV